MGRAVALIFISHSSQDKAKALALAEWLVADGWEAPFINLRTECAQKLTAQWEDALHRAANRCEIVIFLISRAWLDSRWCRDEFYLACHLNKRLFGVLIEELPATDLPPSLMCDWELVDLVEANENAYFDVVLPPSKTQQQVAFPRDGLNRLRARLSAAGLEPKFFRWPPPTDPQRAPYRGLEPLDYEDAGIFFGRNELIVEALDRLRGLRESVPTPVLTILGASGAGKSSFLRAGLLPRVDRELGHFRSLPVIRPLRAAITGHMGLLNALTSAFDAANLQIPRSQLQLAVEGGAPTLSPYLSQLAKHSALKKSGNNLGRALPSLVLAVDQAEELFQTEAGAEAAQLLMLVRDLLASGDPAVIAIFTIRSVNYNHLQQAPALARVGHQTLSLPPIPPSQYREVITGPLRRLDGTNRELSLDETLVEALTVDVQSDHSKGAIPLLAFTLQRLYLDHHADGRLQLNHYEQLGRMAGSIDAALQRAFEAASATAGTTTDQNARLQLLRQILIPWLASVDPVRGVPLRRIARAEDIPPQARPLIEPLVDQRLLTSDVGRDGNDTTLELAHSVLLERWGLLRDWLAEDKGLLIVLDGVKRAARHWSQHGGAATLLAHKGHRLEAADQILRRTDLAASLGPTDRQYLEACRQVNRTELKLTRRVRLVWGAIAVSLLAGILGWFGEQRIRPLSDVALFKMINLVRFFDRPGQVFRDCWDCPKLVVIPSSGSQQSPTKDTMAETANQQRPRRTTVPRPIAVSMFEITFENWRACVAALGCTHGTGMPDADHKKRPVTHVGWEDAQQYVQWLSNWTGQSYRLLSEAEWEYVARAGSTTRYSWGDDIGRGNANCNGCGSRWDNRGTAPVGSFKPNAFGVYDMHGNVWEWVADCWDKTTRSLSGCTQRVVRGGAWLSNPSLLRCSARIWAPPKQRNNILGFRVARDLFP